MRRLFLNRSEPAKKSGQNIPKNRCRTTIAEQMVETRAELPFIGDQVVCLSHDQAARSGPAECGREGSLQPTPTWATRLDPTKSWSGWRLLMAGGCLIGASLSPLCSEHHRS